jgi:hypothetical protein
MESVFLCQVCRLIEYKDEKCLYLKQGNSLCSKYSSATHHSLLFLLHCVMYLFRPRHGNKNCLCLMSDIFDLDRCYFNKTGPQHMLTSVF